MKLTIANAFGVAMCLFPLFAEAAPLTTWEEAAISQRRLTNSEQNDRRAACAIAVQRGKTVELSPGLAGQVAVLRDIELLGLVFAMSEGEPGKISLQSLPDLPNGGIGSRHWCEVVEMIPLVSRGPRKGELVRMTALRLSQDANIDRNYPSAARVARQRKQVYMRGAQRFGVFMATDDAAAERIIGLARQSRIADPRSSAMKIGNRLFVPLAR